jgi:hypothetical protein
VVEQENQLLRQQLEQVQAQMQASQQQCIILQQHQQQQQERKRAASLSAVAAGNKKRKQTATDLMEEEEADAEETQSEEEEEEEDSDDDEEEEEDGDDDNHCDMDSTIKGTSSNNGSKRTAAASGGGHGHHRLSTYGNRKDPIKTPKTNLIDGRSNAAMAFEERCNILRQFIAENGHAYATCSIVLCCVFFCVFVSFDHYIFCLGLSIGSFLHLPLDWPVVIYVVFCFHFLLLHHRNVPTPWSKQLPAKWQFLSSWIEKQFKFYRGMKNGKGTKHLHGRMTSERAQTLKNLGINLDARTNIEEAIYQFHYVHFPTLQAFHAQYGHCCVPAVLNIHVANTTTTTGAATAAGAVATATTAAPAVAVAAPFLDPEFKKWVVYNRVNLRNAKAYDLMVLQKQQQQQVDGDTTAALAAGDPASGERADETNALSNINNDSSKDSTIDNVTKEEPAGTGKQKIEKHPQEQSAQKDGDENQANAASGRSGDNIDGNNNINNAEKKKRKQRREGVERAELKKTYWTEEMTQKLQSLNCPWMNVACDNEIKAYFTQIQQDYEALDADKRNRRKKGTSFQTFPLLNNHTWYENVELFRKYVQEHDGNGLVPVSSYESMSGPSGRLGRFVKDQRKLYDAIRAGSIPSHPIVEQNFALLQAMGFVFDSETLRNDEERRCQEKVNQARAEKEKNSPWAKLEQEKKGVQEAKETVAQAKAVVNEAQKALTKVIYIRTLRRFLVFYIV